MRRARWVHAWALALAACGVPRAPARPAVGVALSHHQLLAVDLAWPLIDTARVALVVDTHAGPESPEGEVRRALTLLGSGNVVAAVGSFGSRSALNSAPIYAERGVPVVFPMATSRLVRDAGPWAFQLCPDDSMEAVALVEHAVREVGARRAAIFYVNDEYGVGLRDALRVEAAARGMTIVAEYPQDEGSRHDVLVRAALREGPLDVVFVAGRQFDTAAIARAVRRRAPGTLVLAGDGALVLPMLADSAGPALDLIRIATFWVPDTTDPRHRTFVGEVRARAGVDPTPVDAMQHDAIHLLATAVAEVGPRADGVAVREWLASLGRSRPPFKGLTGPISFGPERVRPVVIGRFVDGRWQPVEGR